MNDTLLGRETYYPDTYSPEILFAIPRLHNRERLGIHEPLPFKGHDLWRAYEVSWLDARGKPIAMLAEFMVLADSPNIIESKSFKLYLNSLNQKRFNSAEQVQLLLATDLSKVAGAQVLVQLSNMHNIEQFAVCQPEGLCIDTCDVEISVYEPKPRLLHANHEQIVEECLYSDLFKSNCPVTAQPDWGTVVIQYHGPQIDRGALLQYLVSFRQHEGFHEDCTEHVFRDIVQQCRPEKLKVTIHFLRRGGLEIVPVRSTQPLIVKFPTPRLIRQ